MRGVVHACEVLEVQVSIDLRGGDVRVAEQFLHAAQILARLEQVRSERMPEHVRMNMSPEALALRPLRNTQLHRSRRQASAAIADEQRRLIGRGCGGALC